MAATATSISEAEPAAEWYRLSAEETCQRLNVDPAVSLRAE